MCDASPFRKLLTVNCSQRAAFALTYLRDCDGVLSCLAFSPSPPPGAATQPVGLQSII